MSVNLCFDHVGPSSDLLGHSYVGVLTRLCDVDVAICIQALLVIGMRVCCGECSGCLTVCITVQGAWCLIRSGLTTGRLPRRSHDGGSGCMLCVSTTGELM